MQVTHQRVKFRRVWTTLPDMSSLDDLPSPLRPTMVEPLDNDFTEDVLKQVILGTTAGIGGGALSPALVNALPEGFILHIYRNVRYQMPPPDGIFPVRAANYFSSSVHSLPALLLMSRCIYGLYLAHANRIEPDMLTKADNLLRILKQVEYAMYTVLKNNPTANRGDMLVFSGQIITDTVGTGDNTYSEQKYVVYMDEDRLQEYEAAGMTAEEAAQWWFDNKTQPPFPEDE